MTGPASTGPIPATQHAIQIVGVGRLVHNRAKPVPLPGPHQILARIEACGICFSDTKLLHQFSAHPRKSEIWSGLAPEVLAEIPSYVPGELPTVPGHEAVCRIVAVGERVVRHRVGERCLVQTDYRHLPTVLANAAFGYNFEGGLEEYALLDERMIVDPDSGERFLIPVGEKLSASALAFVEPWACVEASYTYPERRGLRPHERLLVVAEPGHAIKGLDLVVEAARPSEIVALLPPTRGEARSERPSRRSPRAARPSPGPPRSTTFLVNGSLTSSTSARTPAGSGPSGCLAPRGLINIVTGGRRIGRLVAVDVGRVHYDLTRWVGSQTDSATNSCDAVPDDGDLRPGDRLAVIGAAGPMGLMHVARAAAAGLRGLSIVAVDIDDVRLAHLRHAIAPSPALGGSTSGDQQPDHGVAAGFSYIALMVPAPSLVRQAVDLAGDGCRINIFAGFANRTRADIDLDRYIAQRLLPGRHQRFAHPRHEGRAGQARARRARHQHLARRRD